MRERNHLTRCLQRDWGFRTFTSPFIFMPQIGFDNFIDDGKLDLPDVPIVFIPYRLEREEPSLHLNDLLYKNHALYHSAHDECPSEDILTSWAYRGMEGMRSFRLLDRYAIERVSPPSIVVRFVKDLDKIHRKLDLTDNLERKRERSRDKAAQTNNRKYRRALNITRELLRRGFSVEEIAVKIAKSVRQVYRRMARLLELGETWESFTDNSVDKSTDMPISPPIHDVSDSAIDAAYTVRTPSAAPVSIPAVTDVSCGRGVKPLTTTRMKRPKEYWIKRNREKRDNANRFALLDDWFGRIPDEKLREIAQEGYLAWSDALTHTPTLGKVRQWLTNVLGKDGRGTELQAKLESVYGVA